MVTLKNDIAQGKFSRAGELTDYDRYVLHTVFSSKALGHGFYSNERKNATSTMKEEKFNGYVKKGYSGVG